MRIVDRRLWLVALAVVALACGPYRHHGGHGPGMGMGMGGRSDACWYRSQWFSDGAMRSNDGVCQSCSGGKWVPGTGCRESSCHEHSHECRGKCGGKPGKPCDHKGRSKHPER